jgi:vancomycin resistance protein VanW
MKHLIPASVRRMLRVTSRWLQDVTRGNHARIVKVPPSPQRVPSSLPVQIELTQAIKVTDFSENKIHNLVLAAQSINDVVVNPGQIFSFWALIGSPSQQRGYLEGRSLVNQQLQAEYGGGLCQLSGLLYHLALKAGLNILERHPHSVDLYTDETRFAPLGSDATVVYGYKDFRFINNLNQPLGFQIKVGIDFVTGQLCAEGEMAEYEIEFMVQPHPYGIEVETIQRSLSNTETLSLGKCCYRSLALMD